MSARQVVVLTPAFERESAADKISRLRAEARTLAREQLDALRGALEQVALLAGEVAEGGDLYPPGAPEMARRLVELCEKQALGLDSITERDRS